MLFIFICYKDKQNTTIFCCLSLFIININKTQISYVVYLYLL